MSVPAPTHDDRLDGAREFADVPAPVGGWTDDDRERLADLLVDLYDYRRERVDAIAEEHGAAGLRGHLSDLPMRYYQSGGGA